mmetsp:Transcript_140988/g.243665  ORF Transcript_140988/g.243665 Transcript_140988/m.243665 type:complete len:187 (-) Transcript_140988:105-665(-)
MQQFWSSILRQRRLPRNANHFIKSSRDASRGFKYLMAGAATTAGVAMGFSKERQLLCETLTCFKEPKGAPKAIGPYCAAVRVGNFLFCSGQIAMDPENGQLVGGGDVKEEAKQVLKNVEAVLLAGGSSMGKVVKATVFLQNIGDFVAVNEIYAEAFKGHTPARSAVEVAKLPKGALVEIEVIAVVN